MADRDNLIQSILIGAIAAAGVGADHVAWKARVNAAIPHVTALISEGGRSWKIVEEVLDASVFEATYLGHELEESSQRIVVQIDTGKKSDNYPDGIEPIRTHRIDNPQGKTMQARLEGLQPGQSMFVWKAIEPVAGSSTKKARVLVHFEKRYSSGANRVTPPAPEEAQPEEKAPAADTSALTDSIDSERLIQWREAAASLLTAAQMKTVVDQLKAKGYSWTGVSEIEWNDEVRPLIRAVRAK